MHFVRKEEMLFCADNEMLLFKYVKMSATAQEWTPTNHPTPIIKKQRRILVIFLYTKSLKNPEGAL